ncbi:MAG: ROK family protein, partial [Phycisphaerae bacterium]
MPDRDELRRLPDAWTGNPMEHSPVIGLDLGGTTMQARLMRGPTTKDRTIQSATQADGGPDHVVDRLIALARKACTQAHCPLDRCAGVGIAAPGPLDSASGIVLQTVNLPGWEHVPLTERISQALGLPAVLINDASAACFGEFRAGAGQGVGHLAMMTLGTGVGGGLIIDGRLVTGEFGHGAELGHMIVHPEGRRCGCGQCGCLEVYAGGLSLE